MSVARRRWLVFLFFGPLVLATRFPLAIAGIIAAHGARALGECELAS